MDTHSSACHWQLQSTEFAEINACIVILAFEFGLY